MTDLDPRLEAAVTRLRALPAERAPARAALRAAIAAEAARSAPASARDARRVVLAPARALLIATALVLATSVLWLAVPAFRELRAGSVAAAGARTPVQFVLVARDARAVAVVGDFNDWNPRATPLAPGPGGVWSVVVPLAPGRFAYSFVVDGSEWRADPVALRETDDYGRPSSVLFVSAAEM
jgi:hypothetical protein